MRQALQSSTSTHHEQTGFLKKQLIFGSCTRQSSRLFKSTPGSTGNWTRRVLYSRNLIYGRKLNTNHSPQVPFVWHGRPPSHSLSPTGVCRASPEDDNKQTAVFSRSGLVLAAGSGALLLAAVITGSKDTLEDVVYDDSFRDLGHYFGAVLWSVALYFSSPWQQLLIFLGKVETERPSDWVMRKMVESAGLDPTIRDFEYPTVIRASAILFFALAGTSVAWSLAAALGDATWSVSTGIGSCFLAAIYEAGRPDRLTADQAEEMEAKYQDFARFADERLQPRGSCHETEIFQAFRRSNAKYRTEEAVSENDLRQYIRNWAKQYMYPTAERTANGYFKKISLRERTDPFTGDQQGFASAKSRDS